MIADSDKKWAEKFLSRCEAKTDRVMDGMEKDYPYSTVDGKYDNLEIFPFNWTSGFFGGIMWLFYSTTGKKKYLDRAVRCSERTNLAFSDPKNFNCLDNHDLGFVFLPTSVAHYRICKDDNARIRGLHAATMLAGRFNLNGKYIRAWRNGIIGSDTRGYAIIDCLLNLPLLYWASEISDDVRFRTVAMAHADTVLKEFVKPDGSVYHIVDFNQETGEVKGYPTGQGYASGSSWSRGQAWAVYGFVMSYIHTHEERYLTAAKRAADYIIANFGEEKLAPSDYMQPKEPKIFDASANAITASGMMELAKYCEEREKYTAFALKLLHGLYDDCDFGLENQAIVQSCSEKYHNCKHHIPLIYADYFLIEALIKITGKSDYFMW